MKFKKILEKLLSKKDLTQKEAQNAVELIAMGEINNSQIASFLTALKIKGESESEILGFIKALKKLMVKVDSSGLVLDIVGTGGDGLGTFNISTATSLVVAGAGVKIAKHGNRASSSKCGSADVLETLGVNINLSPDQAQKVLESSGIVFLFAPLYHPVFKILGPVRKELGFRTVFNYLGPFLNPAQVKHQLLGVPDLEIAKKLSKVASKLNYNHLIIIVSDEGIDEISLSSNTHVFEIKKDQIKNTKLDPVQLGFKKSSINQIQGGDAKMNAEIIRNILSNKEQGPKKDIILLNSAAALMIAGRVKDLKEGINIAAEIIKNGSAKKVLDNLIKESQKYA